MSYRIKTNYIAVLSTELVADFIKENINAGCLVQDILDMISFYSVENVPVIYARVTGTSSQLVNDIAHSLAYDVPEYVNKLVRTGTILTFEYPADITPHYTTSQTKKFVLLGGVAGFGIPFAICLFFGIRDPIIRKKDELEAITDKHVIGEIPNDKTGTIYGNDMSQKVSEAYANLRINLGRLIKRIPHCILVVTSLEKGSGKTLCSTNIALSQMVTGKKVLLISNREQVCDLGSVKNVNITTHIYDNPNSCADFIKRVKDKFDIIIVDTPAVQFAMDAYIFQDIADACIIVARVGKSSMLGQKDMLSVLDSKRELVYGYILNGTKIKKK